MAAGSAAPSSSTHHRRRRPAVSEPARRHQRRGLSGPAPCRLQPVRRHRLRSGERQGHEANARGFPIGLLSGRLRAKRTTLRLGRARSLDHLRGRAGPAAWRTWPRPLGHTTGRADRPPPYRASGSCSSPPNERAVPAEWGRRSSRLPAAPHEDRRAMRGSRWHGPGDTMRKRTEAVDRRRSEPWPAGHSRPAGSASAATTGRGPPRPHLPATGGSGRHVARGSAVGQPAGAASAPTPWLG
jgi:hypothetical protein